MTDALRRALNETSSGIEEPPVFVSTDHDSPDYYSHCVEDDEAALIFLSAAPTVTAHDLTALVDSIKDGGGRLITKDGVLAAAGKKGDLPAAIAGNAAEICSEEPFIESVSDFLYFEAVMQGNINAGHIANGVYLRSPDSTYISPLAQIAPGCDILPQCHILGSTVIGSGCRIGPDCYIENSTIGCDVSITYAKLNSSTIRDNAVIGPYVNIRPGSDVGKKVKLGNFVEVKNSNLGEGTKVSHLTYIGDSDFGENINVGCGVVTVNYDGYKKHRTVVGDDSFIGCNVNLISPVNVGRGAYIAAGSTVTKDVGEGSLVIARSRQEEKIGWATRLREKMEQL